MPTRSKLLVAMLAVAAGLALLLVFGRQGVARKEPAGSAGALRADDRWRDILTPEQYRVTRRKETEPAFSGEYWNIKEPGEYRCVCCNESLFDAETKFDSGTGWPSFWAPKHESSIRTEADYTLVLPREEVMCAKCEAHLGHVFEDGPPPTGLRYCLNSVALRFVPAEEKAGPPGP